MHSSMYITYRRIYCRYQSGLHRFKKAFLKSRFKGRCSLVLRHRVVGFSIAFLNKTMKFIYFCFNKNNFGIKLQSQDSRIQRITIKWQIYILFTHRVDAAKSYFFHVLALFVENLTEDIQERRENKRQQGFLT